MFYAKIEISTDEEFNFSVGNKVEISGKQFIVTEKNSFVRINQYDCNIITEPKSKIVLLSTNDNESLKIDSSQQTLLEDKIKNAHIVIFNGCVLKYHKNQDVVTPPQILDVVGHKNIVIDDGVNLIIDTKNYNFYK